MLRSCGCIREKVRLCVLFRRLDHLLLVCVRQHSSIPSVFRDIAVGLGEVHGEMIVVF